MAFVKRLRAKTRQEPLAVLALIITVTLATLNSNWFWAMFAGKVAIIAHYDEGLDGRCSLVAFALDNTSEETVEGIRIRILNDWLQASGKADDQTGTRATELIPPGMVTPLAYRDDLRIPFRLVDGLILIDDLGQGEYADFFVHVDAEMSVIALRKKQSAEENRHRFTPRLFAASHSKGAIPVTALGNCLADF